MKKIDINNFPLLTQDSQFTLKRYFNAVFYLNISLSSSHSRTIRIFIRIIFKEKLNKVVTRSITF